MLRLLLEYSTSRLAICLIVEVPQPVDLLCVLGISSTLRCAYCSSGKAVNALVTRHVISLSPLALLAVSWFSTQAAFGLTIWWLTPVAFREVGVRQCDVALPKWFNSSMSSRAVLSWRTPYACSCRSSTWWA